MNIFKVTFNFLAVVSVLGLAATASANTRTQAVYGGSVSAQYNAGSYTPGHRSKPLLGSSSTASFFYRKGVKSFDRGNLDKADQAFRAALRANGSTALDALTLRYLIHINQQQGDKFASKRYKQAYFKLAEK